MRMRKERASILMEGWSETKREMAPEAAIMTAMEMTTATIMRETREGSLTMPTAVMTESREKMMSMRAIWMRTEMKLACLEELEVCSSCASSLWWISLVDL